MLFWEGLKVAKNDSKYATYFLTWSSKNNHRPFLIPYDIQLLNKVLYHILILVRIHHRFDKLAFHKSHHCISHPKCEFNSRIFAKILWNHLNCTKVKSCFHKMIFKCMNFLFFYNALRQHLGNRKWVLKVSD